MSVNRIEALRQIIARPTTCEGERIAAQKALESMLSKREASRSAPRAGSSNPRPGAQTDRADLHAWIEDVMRRADSANARARQASGSSLFIDPSLFVGYFDARRTEADRQSRTNANGHPSRCACPRCVPRPQSEPSPPRAAEPDPEVDVSKLPRACVHKADSPDTFRVQVESEARMLGLFRACAPDLIVNLRGEARRVRSISGYARDNSHGPTRWFVLFHYSDLAPKDNP